MIPTALIEHIHLIGIGGSAMTPLAGMLKESNYRVTGSDAGVYPPASTLLESLGIPWKSFSEDNLKPPPDLVVIGNAVSRGNVEVEYVLDHKIAYRSLPEVLKDFFLPGHASIVVAGTHGKTTTTSLLAWIFHVAGRRPNFLIGGVAENFGRSYGLGGGAEFILEGDEYDTAFFDKGPKFLHYRPDELIITSLEFDHADIYPDLASIEVQFRRLVNLVPRHGRIVAWGESPTVRQCVAGAFCPVETYGLGSDADWVAGDLEFSEGATHFRVALRGQEILRARIPLVGRHNVLNALAAAALAHGRGIERPAIEEALETFRSVRRRLEVKGEAAGVTVVDDFAHHPTAIAATIEAARTRWPGRRLWAAFEPRSNTMRRNVFESVLPDALALADAVVLGPVNRPHLLADAERLSPQRVAQQVRALGRAAFALASADEIAEFLSGSVERGDVVLVMSNGSFDGLCEKLLEHLREADRSPRPRGVHR
ncbi:MAG TPA: UDP-N-acetylmuramate:L-alanyl-gamma-D-glutamyl-meso-diaminopimelate ligase [Candidatus Acidoferrales bacterium]|nr:UDP-N-acetylmuramate:L-alanyl-gamma-D-glutamyl-meso-diaminopimelate ligase [Candidatus Acidoferrales bacterium]